MGKETVHNLYDLYELHFHYVLSMGAVFALYSGWYFWIPKILGLDYNLLYSKAHFWVLFAGVIKGKSFDNAEKRFNHQLSGGSPNDHFFFYFLKMLKKVKRTAIKN